MSYKRNLIETIKDSKNWASFDRPKFLTELNQLASEACEKKSTEGYLAGLLIYHQLSEELAKLLLKDAQFFIQLSVFPAEICFSEKRRMMFGQLLDELESTVSFHNKSEFINKCRELNKIRIEFVHGLTRKTTLDDIRMSLAKVETLFDEIYAIFEEAHDYFHLCFKDFKKDIDWDEWEEDLEESNSDDS